MLELLEKTKYFNSRPHGGRPLRQAALLTGIPFQLTPSRRATLLRGNQPENTLHFNSRPHGGRRGSTTPQYPVWNISTHALTEGDSRFRAGPVLSVISTHALTEGDHYRRSQSHIPVSISTHALTEGDSTESRPCPGQMHFNSRPHGGRHKALGRYHKPSHFNSRPHGGRRDFLMGGGI